MRSIFVTPRTLGAAGFGAALVLGLGLAQPSQAATVQNLYEAIYVEQICSGHQFSESEWVKLVDRVRALKHQGYEGEETLFTMVKAKSTAKDLTNQNKCSAESVSSLRSLYANDIASAL